MIRHLCYLLVLCLFMSCRAVPEIQNQTIPEPTRTGDWSEWKIRTSSINVWGLAVISRDKDIRMPAIGERIHSQNSDFAFIQEAWTPEGRSQIQKASQLPFMESFNNAGSIGSGLATLAKVDRTRRTFWEFALNGDLWKIWKGDPAAEKGISLTTLAWKNLPVSFFNVHTIARHGDESQLEDEHTIHRLGQIFETFAMIVEQTDSDAWILAGDLNMRYFQTEYQILDLFFSTTINREEGITKDFCTSCPENMYRDGGYNGQLDYIMLSPRLRFLRSQRDFDFKFKKEGKEYDFSDHFGWTADIAVGGTPRFSPDVVRARITEALGFIQKRFDSTLNGFYPFGVEERFKNRKNLEGLLRKVEVYQQALSGASSNNLEVIRVRNRLNSYIATFRP